MNVRSVLDVFVLILGVMLGILLVRRELSSREPQRAEGSVASQVLTPEMILSLDSAQVRRPRARPNVDAVRVVVLFDVECPFCKRFHSPFRNAEREFGDVLEVGYVHFPLSQHRFARPGAIALECAGQQARFGQMLDAVYQAQDSLGLIDWDSLAVRAGVPDISGFAGCTRSVALNSWFDRNVELGRAIGVQGTPAVVIDGVLLGSPPDERTFFRMVDSLPSRRQRAATSPSTEPEVR